MVFWTWHGHNHAWHYRHFAVVLLWYFGHVCPNYHSSTMVKCPKYHIRHHGSSSIMVPWSNIIVKCPKYHGTMFNTMVVSWYNAQMCKIPWYYSILWYSCSKYHVTFLLVKERKELRQYHGNTIVRWYILWYWMITILKYYGITMVFL